ARRAAHHLRHVGERRRREIVGDTAILQTEETLVLEEQLIEIGAERSDDPDAAAGDELRERNDETSARLVTYGGGKELVELVDQNDQIAAQAPLAPLCALLLLSDLVEGAEDRLDRCRIAMRQQCGELGGRAVIAISDLRQRRQTAGLVLGQIGGL